MPPPLPSIPCFETERGRPAQRSPGPQPPTTTIYNCVPNPHLVSSNVFFDGEPPHGSVELCKCLLPSSRPFRVKPCAVMLVLYARGNIPGLASIQGVDGAE